MLSATAVVTHDSNRAIYADSLFGTSSGTLSYACQQGRRVPGTKGFAVRPKRWIIERTLGWLSCYRRMSKDYERKVQTRETLTELAMTRLLVARQRG